MMRKFQAAGARFAEVGVSHYPRPHGRSQFFRIPAIARSARQLLALWWTLMVRERTTRAAGAESTLGTSAVAAGSP